MPQVRARHAKDQSRLRNAAAFLPGTEAEKLIEEIANHPARDLIVTKIVRARGLGLNVRDPEIVRQLITAAERDQAPADWVSPSFEPPARLDVHVVYYARLDRLVKIGTSGHIRLRVASIATQGLMALEFGDVKRERERHTQFVASHHYREWFRLDEALATHITDVRAAFETQVGMSTEAWLASRPRV